jgi:hypothetical protein
MKIGLGLYRHMLTRGYYDFARQAGCTRVGYGRSRGKRANPKWDGREHGVFKLGVRRCRGTGNPSQVENLVD